MGKGKSVIDLGNVDQVLHVIRNPWGWSNEAVREARLAAANEIERLREENKSLAAAIIRQHEAAEQIAERLLNADEAPNAKVSRGAEADEESAAGPTSARPLGSASDD